MPVKNLSITYKLFAAYSITFVIAVLGIIFGVEKGRRIEQEAVAVQSEAIEDVENIAKLQASLLDFLYWKQTILNASSLQQTDFPQVKKAHVRLQESWSVFINSDEFTELDEDEVEVEGVTETEARLAQEFIDEYVDDFTDYLKSGEIILQSASLEEIQQELKIIEQKDFIENFDSFLEKIQALYEATEEEQSESILLTEQASQQLFQIMLLSVLLSGGLGLFLIYWISRILMSPLKSMTWETQKAVNSGDFDLKVEIDTKDEIGVLAQTFNAYSDFVKELLLSSNAANQKLENTLAELKGTQIQLIQSEKMSSLGQLVAGVAHEINNPVNFVHGNISHIEGYMDDLLNLAELYQQHYSEPPAEIAEFLDDIDLEFMLEDLPKALSSMSIGTNRIQDIVLALRNFSRMDEAALQPTNIHDGIDNTLLILRHRTDATDQHPAIHIVKKYGDLPEVNCYAGLLNQVFMNLLANAIDALEEKMQQQIDGEEKKEEPQIIIRTSLTRNDQWVQVIIADNALGIPEKVREQIFEPFFTTKAVGKGTGMGLSISYQLVTEKHGGDLRCVSTIGQGTEMIIEIPLIAEQIGKEL